MSRPRLLAAGPLTLAFTCALGVTGCSKIRDTKVCRAAVAAVNPAIDEIQTLSKVPGVESQRRIAARYARLASALKPLTPASPSLSAALREYSSIVEATQKALSSHADALQQSQTSRASEARRELERLVRREKSAATRIDAECRG